MAVSCFFNFVGSGVFGLLLCLCLPSPGRADQANVAYGPDPSQTLDICEPSGPAGHPAVVMIHGGGLGAGDKKGYGWLCHQAASRGIVAVEINYRLATGPADHRWPAQLNDVRAAVTWVRSNASKFGIDRTKICLLGDSSGAQLALDIALTHADTRPACVVDQFGPVILTEWGPDENLLGPVPPSVVVRLRHEMSPLFSVDATAPPVLILHGVDDSVVPFSQSESLRDALRSAGDEVRLTAFPGGHGFVGLTDQQRGDLMVSGLKFVLEITAREKSAP